MLNTRLHNRHPPNRRPLLAIHGVVAARDLSGEGDPLVLPEAWSLEALAGRFVELTGGPASAALSLTVPLVLAAQERGDWAAWVTGESTGFFPPDFAEAGIDVAALPLVRVKNKTEAARAADMLLRAGAFALVVLDLDTPQDFSLAMQTRLVGLAKAMQTTLLRIAPAGRAATRGSLVSLRVESEKHRADHDCFVCTARAVKDKRRAPGWEQTEFYSGTDGLC